MDSGIWIAMLLPLFVLLFIIQPQQKRILLSSIKRKRKGVIMTNELVKKYIGKNCIVSTGSFGSAEVGEITEVSDNWIEINTKKGLRLMNADFVTNIAEVLPKQHK